MNSCILMATIIDKPQLRATQDGMQVANALIEFESLREEEPPAKIKLSGWGRVAEEIHNNYNPGDRVIIEGRLSMNLVKMNNRDYSEKRAELVASRIYPLGAGGGNISANSFASNEEIEFTSSTTPASSFSNNNVNTAPEPAVSSAPSYETTEVATVADSSSETADDGTWDEIPF